MQLTHNTTLFEHKTNPIVILADGLTNASNIGGLFRVADAFGVEQLLFTNLPNPLTRKVKKVTRATEQYVKYKSISTPIDTVKSFKGLGYTVIGLEITSESRALQNYKFDKKQPILLIVGHENEGISEQLVAVCDVVIHINMFGKNSSMNVVQATSIALYEMTKVHF